MWHVRRRGEKHRRFWCGNLRKDTTWEHSNRWEYNIKVHLEAVELEVMYWIDLAQDRDRWRVLVNAVVGTFGFHKVWGIS